MRDPWDHDDRTVRLPVETETPHGREGRDDPSWPDREGREGHEGHEAEQGGPLDRLDGMRFVRDSPRTATEKIRDGIERARALPPGPWRAFNLAFACTIGPVVILTTASLEWALGENLARFLLAVPVILALAFVLNHIPITAWFIPNQLDVSDYFPQDPPPDMVEVPIVPPPARGDG